MSDPIVEPVVDVRPKMTFAGKCVLVAGHGIIARTVAEVVRDRGAHVALATANDDESSIQDIAVFPTALATESDVDRLIDGVVDRLERLDVIIIVIATEPLGGIDDMSLEQWRRGVADPLRQLFWLTRRAIEELLADAIGARVVLVLDPAPNGERNEVVDDAISAFARSFAREYGSRALACNVIRPMLSPATGALAPSHVHAIVEHVLFLAASTASFVNGETMVVELPHRAQDGST